MGRTESTLAGRMVAQDQETGSGLLVQNAESTDGTPTFSADDDQQFGQVECWLIKMSAVADQAYDAAAAITNVFKGTKVARTRSYRILGVRTILRSLRTGGTPDHDMKVETGDGAASETFADLVATVDVDTDTLNSPVERVMVDAQSILLTGETLRVQMSVAGTTTGGTAAMDVYILAIPVVA